MGVWPGQAGLLVCWLPGARVTQLPGPTGTHNSSPSLASPSPWQSWAQEGATCCDFLPSFKTYKTFSKATSGGAGVPETLHPQAQRES